MVAIKLPDGSVMNFDGAVSGKEVAEKISAGLAKNALAVKVNDKLQDLAATITTDATVTVITAKDKEGLAILRHSCSHVMAEAVKELWPDVQVTIGPAIENGFYYDFARKEPFTTEDFAKIEAKMHEIVKRDEEVSRKVLPRNEAIDYFKSIGEHYKVELIEDLPENEVISLYTQGNFTDLCRGPHVPSTGKIGDAFKLTKVAGLQRRLLARRLQPRNAAAHLCHRLGKQKRPAGISDHAGRGGKTRPPQTGTRNGPFPL